MNLDWVQKFIQCEQNVWGHRIRGGGGRGGMDATDASWFKLYKLSSSITTSLHYNDHFCGHVMMDVSSIWYHHTLLWTCMNEDKIAKEIHEGSVNRCHKEKGMSGYCMKSWQLEKERIRCL